MILKEEHLITQKTFRTLLQAMSHPGRVYQLEQKAEDRSQITDKYNLSPVFYSLSFVLQTLLDHEAGFCVVGKGKEYLKTAISELTGCPPKDISDADFIIISDGESYGEILKAKRGSLAYPDTGATVIYAVESLSDSGNEKPVAILKGPGIRNYIAPCIHGLGKNEFFYIKEINSEFPLGIDCIFIDNESRIMCIPRSTKIEA